MGNKLKTFTYIHIRHCTHTHKTYKKWIRIRSYKLCVIIINFCFITNSIFTKKSNLSLAEQLKVHEKVQKADTVSHINKIMQFNPLFALQYIKSMFKYKWTEHWTIVFLFQIEMIKFWTKDHDRIFSTQFYTFNLRSRYSNK